MKRLLVLLAISLLLGIGTVSSAECQQGYNALTFSVIDRYMSNGTVPQATVILVRCTCLPVNNYLYAGVRVQFSYNNGQDYSWSPSFNQYVNQHRMNTYSVTATAYTPNSTDIIVYAKAHFDAWCGNNDNSFDREWTGDPGESIGVLIQ